MRESINLERRKVKSKKGVIYEYWYLRWFGLDGRFHGKSIGRTDKISKRQAMKLRQQKVIELDVKPGRRNLTKAPDLGDYINGYFKFRKNELAPSTIILHKQTARYLLGFFGEHRRIDQISKPDARAFKTT